MQKLLNKTPFLRLLLPLVAGIVAFTAIPKVPVAILVTIFSIAIVCIFLSFFIKKSKNQFAFRWIFGVVISLLLLVSGYFLSFKKNIESDFNFHSGKNFYAVELTSAPVEKRNSYMVHAKIIGFQNDTAFEKTKGNVLFYIQKNDSAAMLLYGDILLLEAELQPPQKALNPDAFDFGMYLRRQGISATAYIPANYWKYIGKNTNFSIFRIADRCQKFLLGIYRNLGLSGDEFAIVAALTLGYTDEIAPELSKQYSASGAVHILSVSGLHVAIVYGFLMFILGLFLKDKRWKKIVKSLLIIICLWAYATLTGLSPSVMRAAFMCSVVAAALCFDRKSKILNSIFLSAFVLLLVNPNNLFNIGFQLSYAAVISIVIFAVPANNLLKTKNKVIIFVIDTFIVSVAAQLGTVPFTIYYFHAFPTWFLLTNLIAIPLSTLIIYVAITTLAFSAVPVLSTILASLLQVLLLALNGSIRFIFELPMSVLSLSWNFEQMWLLVLSITFAYIFYYSKKFLPALLTLCCILSVFFINLKIKYQTLNSQKVVVYSAQKNTHISFIQGNENTVFTTDSVDIQTLAKSFWDNNKLHEPNFIGENGYFSDGFIEFRNKKFYILTNDFFRRKTTNSAPLYIDYLVVGALQKPKMEQLLTCFTPKNVIICNGVSAFYTSEIEKICNQNNIPAYSVEKNGAFVINL
ncbi:MAG: ComEC family competence protein [Paludibacter sp.]|nr:ComEC family competence protein [Paludibacter sp.]